MDTSYRWTRLRVVSWHGTEGIGVKIVFTLWICNSSTSLYFYCFQQRHYETVRILIRSKRRGKTDWTFLNYCVLLGVKWWTKFLYDRKVNHQDNQLFTRNVTQLCIWLYNFWVRPCCKLLLFCMYALSTSNVLFYSWLLQMTTVGPTNFNWFYKWREKYRYNLPVLIYLSKFPLFQRGALHFSRASEAP